MILCVTPNPAIDRTLVIAGFRTNAVNRSTDSLIAAGGKGLNAARAAKTLGGEVYCAGFLGGFTGQYLAHLAQQEGLQGEWTWIQGETRACTMIVNTPEVTVINEAGPTVTDDDWRRLQSDVLKVADSAQIVCISGSLPAGSSQTAFSDFLINLRRAGKSIWVDTSGTALKSAFGVPGLCLKVNQDEASALVRQPIPDKTAALHVVAQLVEQGHPTVVITLGADGAILADENGALWACPPQIQSVSNVGSGDSVLGALAVALTLGHPPAEALRWGVAAGSANALSLGGARFTLSDFQHILRQTIVSTL